MASLHPSFHLLVWHWRQPLPQALPPTPTPAGCPQAAVLTGAGALRLGQHRVAHEQLLKGGEAAGKNNGCDGRNMMRSKPACGVPPRPPALRHHQSTHALPSMHPPAALQARRRPAWRPRWPAPPAAPTWRPLRPRAGCPARAAAAPPGCRPARSSSRGSPGGAGFVQEHQIL